MIPSKKNSGFAVPVYTIILVIVLMATGVGDSPRPLVNPDGAIGSVNVFVHGQYLSISSKRGIATRDHQQLGMDLNLPVSQRFTVAAGYSLEPNDTLFHRGKLGITIYSKKLGSGITSVNPDGPTGAPVVSAVVSTRIRDGHFDDRSLRISARLLLPTTNHLTVGMGANYYETDNPLIIDEFFGLVNWFMKRYDENQLYINPDGLPGYPVFRLIGGGNSKGIFGQLDILMPMSPRYSLSIWMRGEKITAPEIQRLGLGAGVNLYPGTN
jgi:hypothetical protein